MNTMNQFLVGTNGEDISIIMPPRGPITKEEALVFAAWLVVLADPSREKFNEAFEKVSNT